MRKQLTQSQIDKTIDEFKQLLKHRLDQKGYGSFSSIHEAYGIIMEEIREYEKTVKDNDKSNMYFELMDIAIACVFACVCIRNNTLEW